MTSSYVNEYDQPLLYQCPEDKFVNGFRSIHDNTSNDRRTSVQCCSLKGYVNEYDQPLLYQCPEDKFVNGFRSIHDNTSNDRRTSVQCCSLKGRKKGYCYLTSFLDSYDEPLDYTVPDGHYIHGIVDFHENNDAVHSFEVCEFEE
ncbi:dermatopontin-like [Pecten maximus]|uniref:dermatopontin-like n=1 Tax=Pecten maximus TaxID=6579 RepID=UPI0014585245|nr:dermatopontin-like [Pecten maximus]